MSPSVFKCGLLVLDQVLVTVAHFWHMMGMFTKILWKPNAVVASTYTLASFCIQYNTKRGRCIGLTSTHRLLAEWLRQYVQSWLRAWKTPPNFQVGGISCLEMWIFGQDMMSYRYCSCCIKLHHFAWPEKIIFPMWWFPNKTYQKFKFLPHLILDTWMGKY